MNRISPIRNPFDVLDGVVGDTNPVPDRVGSTEVVKIVESGVE